MKASFISLFLGLFLFSCERKSSDDINTAFLNSRLIYLNKMLKNKPSTHREHLAEISRLGFGGQNIARLYTFSINRIDSIISLSDLLKLDSVKTDKDKRQTLEGFKSETLRTIIMEIDSASKRHRVFMDEDKDSIVAKLNSAIGEKVDLGIQSSFNLYLVYQKLSLLLLRETVDDFILTSCGSMKISCGNHAPYYLALKARNYEIGNKTQLELVSPENYFFDSIKNYKNECFKNPAFSHSKTYKGNKYTLDASFLSPGTYTLFFSYEIWSANLKLPRAQAEIEFEVYK